MSVALEIVETDLLPNVECCPCLIIDALEIQQTYLLILVAKADVESEHMVKSGWRQCGTKTTAKLKWRENCRREEVMLPWARRGRLGCCCAYTLCSFNSRNLTRMYYLVNEAHSTWLPGLLWSWMEDGQCDKKQVC